MTDDNKNLKIFIKLLKCITNDEDAEHLYNCFYHKINNDIMHQLMKNMIKKKTYNNIGINKFIYHMNKLNDFNYRDDAREYLKNLLNTSLNKIQKKCILRIIDQKKINLDSLSNDSSNEPTYKIKKYCPHCNKKTHLPENTTYVICGYNNKRMDNNNKCGKDWCFRCGKKLCKSWFLNDLFTPQNRFHTNNCCFQYAQSSEEEYCDKYCQCNSIYVNHNI